MSSEALVDHVERHTTLDVIAITDHDETSAALVARDYAARRGYRVQVVPGVEVTTRDGHMLALFVEDRPAALLPMLKTAEWVRTRGGLVLAPHPFTRLTHSLSSRAMLQAHRQRLLAGVEVLNASPAGRASRERALRFVDQYGLAAVGGSDAHMLGVVGLACTRFRGHTPAELRHALETAATGAEGRFASPREMAPGSATARAVESTCHCAPPAARRAPSRMSPRPALPRLGRPNIALRCGRHE
jgi:predicted metal-dependent phosphoesterase TrpH